MALTVNHCCCGCSLRTGTTIIAVYLLVCSILLVVFSSIVLYYVAADVEEHRLTVMEYDMLRVKNDRELKVALISGIVGGLVQAILNALLLVGVKKEKYSLVIIWLVAYVVIFGLSLLSFVISFFQFPTYPHYQVAAVISIGMSLYFLLVVRSYHHSLVSGYNKRQNAANVYNTENSNIKRMPLEEHICTVLRKKWKYLRDQFSVEFWKIMPLRSGDLGGECYELKWPLYRSLLFLKDIVKPRASSSNLKSDERASMQSNLIPSNEKTVDSVKCGDSGDHDDRGDSVAFSENGNEDLRFTQYATHDENQDDEEVNSL